MNYMDREFREYEEQLYNKIKHERFSFKKILHILQLGYICEGNYRSRD